MEVISIAPGASELPLIRVPAIYEPIGVFYGNFERASSAPPPRLCLSPGGLDETLSLKCLPVLVFPFLEWDFTPNLAPAHFVVLRARVSNIRKPFFNASCRSVSKTRLRNPALNYLQPNTSFVSLFFAPCASPPGCCGAHIGLLALSSVRLSY